MKGCIRCGQLIPTQAKRKYCSDLCRQTSVSEQLRARYPRPKGYRYIRGQRVHRIGLRPGQIAMYRDGDHTNTDPSNILVFNSRSEFLTFRNRHLSALRKAREPSTESVPTGESEPPENERT